MNMPGFTATASLYRTSRHYRMTAGSDLNPNSVEAALELVIDGTEWGTVTGIDWINGVIYYDPFFGGGPRGGGDGLEPVCSTNQCCVDRMRRRLPNCFRHPYREDCSSCAAVEYNDCVLCTDVSGSYACHAVWDQALRACARKPLQPGMGECDNQCLAQCLNSCESELDRAGCVRRCFDRCCTPHA
jgi:hypothetical protein